MILASAKALAHPDHRYGAPALTFRRRHAASVQLLGNGAGRAPGQLLESGSQLYRPPVSLMLNFNRAGTQAPELLGGPRQCVPSPLRYQPAFLLSERGINV